MKPLILIASCARDRSTQNHQRKLFSGADYRFVLGAGNSCPAEDELILPVRDDYWALPAKMRHAFRWALEQMEQDGKPTYTHIFKADTDTFIHVDRLLDHWAEIALRKIDYLGLVGNPGDCCGGGAGYWLSRKAMIVYLESYDERQLALSPRQRLEDWCLFWSLDRATPRISPECDRRYWDLRLGPIPDLQTNITWNPWKP